MNKLIRLFFGLLIFLTSAGFLSAQQGGEWTWMHGNQPANALANYGVQGVPSPTNTPGFRYESLRWVDLQGNLWLHGGQSNDPQGGGGSFSDMWMYDISLGMWVWMNGPMWSSTSFGTYIQKGVFSPNYYPASAGFGNTEFTDADGNFWLLEGNGSPNLWKYDVSINQWAWMHGPGFPLLPYGSPGTQNVFAPTNMPGSFTEHHSGWGDTLGNLWLFGGNYITVPGCSDLVWTYDTQLNQWKWVSGNPAQLSGLPVYGIQNVPSPLNTPGPRNVYISWKSSADELYIYGHGGFCGADFLDLWKYNIGTGEWTWVSGIQGPQFTLPNQQTSGICVPSATDFPVRSLESHLNANKLNCDLFYTYGGEANLITTHLTLYRYNAATNKWTLLFEDLTGQRVYGTYQVPGPNVMPGEHWGGVAWVDNNGNYWVYGGMYNGSNELWRFIPTIPQADFTCDTAVCLGDTVHFALSLTGLCGLTGSLHWDFGDPSVTTDTSSAAAIGWVYAQPGTYTATLIAFDSTRCDIWGDTHQVVITVYPQPVVDLGSDTVLCPPQQNYLLDAGNPGFTYSWSTGATTQTISPGSSGVYSVTVSAASCSASDTVQLTFTAAPVFTDTSICAGQSITLNAGVPGQYIWSTGDTTAAITVTASGIYSVTVIHPPCTLMSSMQLIVNPLPVVNLGADTILCPGSTLLLDAQNSGAVWNWNTGANTQTLLVNSGGIYGVTVISQPGNCFSSDSINLQVAGQLSLGPDVSLCGQLNGIVLQADSNATFYLWNTGDTSRTITVTQPGQYWVTTVSGSCTQTDTITVAGNLGEAIVFVPNTFTPNGDGLNDWFAPVGDGITEFHLMVFNRWGELIFETRNPMGWDGKYANKLAENEVYVYRLSYKSSCTGNAVQMRLGHVLLMR